MRTKDNNGELSCAALPLVTRSSSDIRHLFLPKMCSPALMGCSILIWLHKKKIWAFILFRKQHSSFTKAFSAALRETGIQQLFPFASCLMWYSLKKGFTFINTSACRNTNDVVLPGDYLVTYLCNLKKGVMNSPRPPCLHNYPLLGVN